MEMIDFEVEEVFEDEDGSYYMYFGGLWGGQLQRWHTGSFNGNQPENPTAHIPKDHEPALLPLVAKMTKDYFARKDTPND